ncbi:MAG TPA: bifunctional phosphoglucose/phosphomannose isomerase [Thermoleophilia bacterium]|nr:bifunctional phosphoglucose/phosphomannose isomerase [Thermoleophilia bacterium]
MSRDGDEGVRMVAGGDLSRARAAALDSEDQFAAVAGLSRQLDEGWRAARWALTDGRAAADVRPDGVAVCGMGGSAIGADVVGACLATMPVPYQVVRGYALPGWVTARSLVIAVSYSGDTAETLSCVDDAVARGARPLCVASGGALGSVAAERDLPFVPVPAGLRPRAALGYLATPVAAALEATGLVDGFADQVGEAVEITTRLAAELGLDAPDDSQAKRLARDLAGRLPLVYGGGVTAPAARRWKGQLNENAETPAFFNEVPELDHNELAGWVANRELGERAYLVLLDDPAGDERLRRRLDLTAVMVEPLVAGVARVEARGASPFARVVSSLYVGDFVSLYLALLYGVDPGPITALEELKRQLAAPGAGV